MASTGSLIHACVQQREPGCTSALPGDQERKRDGKEGHPPFQRAVNPTLRRGDDCRRTAVRGCVSQDSLLSAAPYGHVSRLSPERGWWQTEILSPHKCTDKKHHFPLHCRSLLQLSTGGPDSTGGGSHASCGAAVIPSFCVCSHVCSFLVSCGVYETAVMRELRV